MTSVFLELQSDRAELSNASSIVWAQSSFERDGAVGQLLEPGVRLVAANHLLHLGSRCSAFGRNLIAKEASCPTPHCSIVVAKFICG